MVWIRLRESRQAPASPCLRATLPKWMMACAEAWTPNIECCACKNKKIPNFYSLNQFLAWNWSILCNCKTLRSKGHLFFLPVGYRAFGLRNVERWVRNDVAARWRCRSNGWVRQKRVEGDFSTFSRSLSCHVVKQTARPSQTMMRKWKPGEEVSNRKIWIEFVIRVSFNKAK